MKINKKYNSILIVIITILVSSCAQIVTPSGGNKDTTPPEVETEEPISNNTNFNSNKITITFNEYFDLINPNEKIIFSPPQKNQPDFNLKNKKLIININDTLKENTTYSIYFDNCLKDITEGNILKIYQYAFSTGENIDTLKILGRLFDSFTKEIQPNIYILLYDIQTDSMPLTQKPNYITKSDNSGNFSINNLKKGEYKIFALDDKNNNLIFDQFTEKFAFQNQTIVLDSNNISKIELTLYQQNDTTQKLLKQISDGKGIYKLSFRKSIKEASFQLLDTSSFDNRFIKEINSVGDTLTLFDTYYTPDTLKLVITQKSFVDTISFCPSCENRSSKRKQTENTFLVCNLKNAKELYKTTFIESVLPIKNFASEKIKLRKIGIDTTDVPVNIFFADSLKKILTIDFKKIEKENYLLYIEKGAISGYNNKSNDTIIQKFAILSEDDYGNFQLTIESKKNNSIIVQFVSDKKEVVKETSVQNNGIIKWQNLAPGLYKIRVIFDENKNGRWDNGNYFLKQTPEPIYYFYKTIQIRAKWDIEETFDIDNPIY